MTRSIADSRGRIPTNRTARACAPILVLTGGVLTNRTMFDRNRSLTRFLALIVHIAPRTRISGVCSASDRSDRVDPEKSKSLMTLVSRQEKHGGGGLLFQRFKRIAPYGVVWVTRVNRRFSISFRVNLRHSLLIVVGQRTFFL